jgi:hypothetical protein
LREEEEEIKWVKKNLNKKEEERRWAVNHLVSFNLYI